MKTQRMLLFTCFSSCILTKLLLSGSFFALLTALCTSTAAFIFFKTVLDVRSLRNCTKEYNDFVERLKQYNTKKNK